MTFDKVKQIILSELNIDPAKINLESRIAEDLGADSLDAVELIMNVEDEFGISISDEDATNIKTVGQLVSFVDSAIK